MEKTYEFMVNEIDTSVVILCNGEYPENGIPAQILADAKMVICCDGAADEYIKRGKTPYAIVGDGDSLSENVKKHYANLLVKYTDQETNDLTKSVHYLFDRGIKDFAIVGATGKREDHALGNISLLMDFYDNGANTAMFTEYGAFYPTKNNSVFKTYKGEQISIINFGAVNLQSKDLVYPIYDFTRWWQGTLNQATGEKLHITANGYYLVYLNY